MEFKARRGDDLISRIAWERDFPGISNQTTALRLLRQTLHGSFGLGTDLDVVFLACHLDI